MCVCNNACVRVSASQHGFLVNHGCYEYQTWIPTRCEADTKQLTLRSLRIALGFLNLRRSLGLATLRKLHTDGPQVSEFRRSLASSV